MSCQTRLAATRPTVTTTAPRSTTRFASFSTSLNTLLEVEMEDTAAGDQFDVTACEEKEVEENDDDDWAEACNEVASRSINESAIATYSLLEPASPLIPTITLTECERIISNPNRHYPRWDIPWSPPNTVILSGQAEYLASTGSWQVGTSIFKALPELRHDNAAHRQTKSSSSRFRSPPPIEDEFADVDLDSVPYKLYDRDVATPRMRGTMSRHKSSSSSSSAPSSLRSSVSALSSFSSSLSSSSSSSASSAASSTKSAQMTNPFFSQKGSRFIGLRNLIGQIYRNRLAKYLQKAPEVPTYDHDEALDELHAMVQAAYNPAV